MKTAVVLTSLLAALAINAQALPLPISVTALNVTGATNADGSNVTVTATITIADITHPAMVTLGVKSTDNLVGQVFPPDTNITFVAYTPADVSPTAGICHWTNTSWNPYFTGTFVVEIVAMNLTVFGQAASNTTVTVNRTIGGTLNSVKVASDVSPTEFVNIDTTKVFAHSPGIFKLPGAVGTPLNLMNVTNPVYVSKEQMDIAYMDTGAYKPSGTPFRFDMDMHARPTSIMGFGEIMRFVWTPAVATNPAGRGNLVVDVVSRQPWRNGYLTNFQAHVGCAPTFMDPGNVEMAEGMIMSTTAHYMDVSPEENAVGVGLKVNGQTNTTSYLKAFIPDTLLETWGIPVALATNLLTGWTTHFNSSGASEGDTTAVTTEFTRIAGGDTNYAYYSTNGDAGYLAEFTFTFHSPVAAQIGLIAVQGDFDGDRLADPYWPVKSDVQGMWTIWRSSADYTPFVPVMNTPLAGGQAIRVADFEGDGRADLAMVANGNWYIWLSSSGYPMPQGPSFIMEAHSGDHWVAADFDGDRKADPAMVMNGNWYFWLSSSGYPTPQGPSIMMSAPSGAECLAADFDGDRKADPVMVVNGNWYFCMSMGGGYVQQGPFEFSVPGADLVPMVGDFDNDVLADMVMVVNNNWTFWLSSGGYGPSAAYEFAP